MDDNPLGTERRPGILGIIDSHKTWVDEVSRAMEKFEQELDGDAIMS